MMMYCLIASPDISPSPSSSMPHSCHICSKTFTLKGNLKVHLLSHDANKRFECDFCSVRFTRRSNLKIHILKIHGSNNAQVGSNPSKSDQDRINSTSQTDKSKNQSTAKRKCFQATEGSTSASKVKRKCHQPTEGSTSASKVKRKCHQPTEGSTSDSKVKRKCHQPTEGSTSASKVKRKCHQPTEGSTSDSKVKRKCHKSPLPTEGSTVTPAKIKPPERKNQASTQQSQRRDPYNMGFIQTESVAQNRLITYKITPEEETSSCLPSFLNSIKDSIIQILQRNLGDHPTIKTNIFMEVAFKKPINGNPEEFEYCTRNLKTYNTAIYRATDLEQFCDEMSLNLDIEMVECEIEGSAWTFSHVLCLELRVNRFKPM